jgi:uncharacterized protein
MRLRRTDQDSTHAKVEFLRHSAAYPQQQGPVEVIETHFSWVFLTATQAYKMKKPVRQASMDYRTITGRRRGCKTEVRLNRRLAPAVYLGVQPLRRDRAGRFGWGDAGRVVDWLVVMQRLPAARMLDEVLKEKGVTPSELQGLVTLLGGFYARARRRPMSPRRYLQHCYARTVAQGRELQRSEFGLPAGMVEALIGAQLGFIHLQSECLGARGGRLVDAQGDLRPEHVYLGSGSDAPAVIDCLEFDATLRRLDPMEEIASLAMECMGQGATALSRQLLNRMRIELQDPAADSLVHFYMSQRAATRAKLAVWHLRDPNLAPRFGHWHRRAREYLDSAVLFARLALRQSRKSQSLLEGNGPALDERAHRLSRQHPSEHLTD